MVNDKEHVLDTARIEAAVHSKDIDLRIEGDTAIITVDGIPLERPWITFPERRGDDDLRAMSSVGTSLVLATRVRPALSAKIRDRGGWYADATGSLYVRAPGIFVDVKGSPPTRHSPAAREGGRSQAINLMSPARAQVIFCLLAWPELANTPLRHIADCAGVSISLVHTVMTALEEGRFLSKHRHGLDRPAGLIDQWATAFPLGLGRSLELGRFRGEPSPSAWVDAGHVVDVSGEGAAPGLRGAGMTLYVPEMDPRAVLRSRWERADDHANIVVRRRFWTDPLRHREPEAYAAPDLLIYADLLASGEPRQLEVANSMRTRLHELHAG